MLSVHDQRCALLRRAVSHTVTRACVVGQFAENRVGDVRLYQFFMQYGLRERMRLAVHSIDETIKSVVASQQYRARVIRMHLGPARLCTLD